jgi:hypothetical protein
MTGPGPAAAAAQTACHSRQRPGQYLDLVSLAGLIVSIALLAIRERVLGPEHPHALATRHEHARWTGDAGDAAAARDQYAALLPIRERVLGPEHEATLATRDNLAYWTEKAGSESRVK